LAQPQLNGNVAGARRVVLLMDLSASMNVVEQGERSRFELARESAGRVIRGLSQGNSCLIVGVGVEPEILHPFSDHKRELQAVLDRLEPSHGEADFSKAARLIEELPAD